jgi:RNA polymerase sigma-70 factor (ECF subfamily)
VRFVNAELMNPDMLSTFLAYRAKLRQAALKILGSRDQAEDVLQEVYLKIVEATSTFNARQPVAYLYQTVRNLSIDHHRRSQLESNIFAEEEGAEIAAGAHTPERIAIARQSLRQIVATLNQLPERTRKTFELYHLSGHTQRDIAVMLGVSTTLVNFMLRDASEALEQCRSRIMQDD